MLRVVLRVMSVYALALIVEGLAEAKVGDLRGEFGVEQNVACGQISVNKTLRCQVPSSRMGIIRQRGEDGG